MKVALAFAGLLLAASPAPSQDIAPVLDLPELSRGHVISSTAKVHGDRGHVRGRAGTPRQEAACAQKARFRAEYGASSPKVQRLYSLCRGIGR